MLRWIAQKLFPRPEPDATTVATFERDDWKADVITYTKRCGHLGHMVEISVYIDKKKEWFGSGIFNGEDLQTAILMLQQSAHFIGQESGSRSLPTVILRGNGYFADERLRELRGVDNPHERVALDFGAMNGLWACNS